MRTNSKGIFIALTLVQAFLLTACYNQEAKPMPIYYGESAHWSAVYDASHGNDDHHTQIRITFTYKSVVKEIARVKKLSFAYGTSEGNTVKTLNFDAPIGKSEFPVDYQQDYVTGILSDKKEVVFVIVDWDNQQESFNLKLK